MKEYRYRQIVCRFLAIVGGVAYYFKIYKPKKEQEVENDEGVEHMEGFESVEE